MALPKIEHPVFELELPSNKKVIKYRPFLVKEEKILLIAMQGDDAEEIINSIKQVVNNCIVSEDVDIDDIPTIDLEYLFIKIRSKSVNNIINLTYKDLEDEKLYDVEVDLDKVEIKYIDGHSSKIEINDRAGFNMKYPTAGISKTLKDVDNEADLFFDILKYCIYSIYDGDNVYMASDANDEELEEFVQNLDVKTFKKIQDFFASMPRLHYVVTYTNSLGKEKSITLSNLNDFFMLG